MRIEWLELHNYRCFPHLRLDFAPGLNVINGPNGAGKSTVQRALLKALFDRPAKTQANLADQAWGSSQMYTLSMVLAADGAGTWFVHKDFENGRARLEDEQGQAVNGAQAVQQKLHELIGVASDRLFVSTVFVRQSEVAAISDGQSDITRSLEERVTGGSGGVDTQSILQRLDNTVKEYRRGYETTAPANPGPIGRLTGEQGALQRTIQTLRGRIEQQAADWARREELEAELARLADDLLPKQQVLAAAGRVQQLRVELARAEEEEAALDSLTEAIGAAGQEIQSALSAIEQLAPISKLSDDEVRRLNEGRLRLEHLQQAPVAQPPPVKPSRLASIGPWMAAALGVLAAVAGVWLRPADPQGFLPGVVALFAAGALLAAALIWLGVGRLQEKRGQANRRMAYQLAVHQRQQEIAAAQAGLQKALAVLGVAAWPAYEAKRVQASAALLRQQQAQIRLETLLGPNRTLEEVERARLDASRARRDGEERLTEPELQEAAALSSLDQARLAREVQRLGEAKANQEQEMAHIRFRLEDNPVDAEALLQAEERSEEVKLEIERRRFLLAVYRRTPEALTAAREQTIAQMRAQLEELTSGYFERLTAGRYARVAIDRELRLTVASTAEEARWIAPDALYFAARLALTDLLFAGNPPPLLLDDPFVTFDAERRGLAHRLCHEIAADRQVLLFTCADEYDALGQVIGLGIMDS